MSRKLTFVIPTYSGVLLGTNKLEQLLDSLANCNSKNFRTILLNTCSAENKEAEIKISELVKKYNKRFPTISSSEKEVKLVKNLFEREGFSRLAKETNLNPFSNFRNFGLITAIATDSEIIALIDDDQVIQNQKFPELATDGIGEKFNGKKILGKTGYYLYEDCFELPPQKKNIEENFPVATMMNKTFKQMIESKGRYCETRIALGGAMILEQELFSEIPFDPHCLRGEDCSYTVSCKNYDKKFVFDSELAIIHNPIRETEEFERAFLRNIYRFMYERNRIKHFGIKSHDLDPYPGFFLKENFEELAQKTSEELKKQFPNFLEKHGGFEKVINKAREFAIQKTGHYPEFKKEWKKAMTAIKEDEELCLTINKFQE